MNAQSSAIRRTFALLTAGVIAVIISGWLVFDFAARLAEHSKRQTTATEYALTLTRVASKVAEYQSGRVGINVLQDDSMARLIAMGDVQSSELVVEPGSGLLKRPEIAELHAGGEAIALQWSSIRNSFSGLSAEAVTDGNISGASGFNTDFIESLNLTFDTVFNAVTNETLSVPLLRSVSAIKAELSNLLFISRLSLTTDATDNTNSTLERLLKSVSLMQKQSQTAQGGSLLGYESNLLLQGFVQQVSQVAAAALSNQPDTATVKRTVNGSGIQDLIRVALDQNEIYRRALDGAIYQYRRSILGALACMCAALLMSAVVTWRLWRLKSQPVVQAIPGFSALIEDINSLADGDLNAEVRSASGDSASAEQSRMIAQGVNYTARMLRGLVNVSQGVAHRTRELSEQQHQIAEDLIQTDHIRQREIVSLVEGLNHRTTEIQELCNSQVSTDNDLISAKLDGTQNSKTVAFALADISAQAEQGSSRVSRAVDTISELAIMVDKMKVLAEKSSLQALNTSIKMTAYSDGGDSDVSPQFVDQVQRISRTLEANAADATRLIDTIKTDLHSSELAMASCRSAIAESTDHSIRASESLAEVSGTVDHINTSNTRLIAELKNEAENLDLIANKLCQLYEATIEKNRLPELIESTLDFQLMAKNFDESLSRYKIKRDQTVDG